MALGPQFEQLKMFMTAREVMDYVNHSYDLEGHEDDDGNYIGETMEDLWDRKLYESMQPYNEGHGGGVYDAIKSGKDLFNNPDNPLDAGNTVIAIGKDKRTLTDRHHRIAAQEHVDHYSPTPRYLPIEYGVSGWL